MKRQNSRTSARKKVDRTVTKKCPKCPQECPVARKSCECGHQFPTRTRSSVSRSERESNPIKPEDPELAESKRRRFRTKRMRPDFFNPLDMEYSSRRRSRSTSEVQKKKRGRPKGSINKPKPERPEPKPTPPPEDDNLFGNLPPEKTIQLSIILAELNNKFSQQNFKPS